MEKQFTASEVRDYLFSIEERSSRQWLIARDAELGMLREFADLLEAQERAVPVATVRWHSKHGFNWREVGSGPHGDLHTGWIDVPLYTHPAPSDAERLAEALQPFANLLQSHHASIPDDRPIYRINKAEITAGDLRRANEALAAHSAQAQPPAARVPDAMPKVPVNADEVEFGCLRSLEDACWNAGWNACRDAMLAAQESLNG